MSSELTPEQRAKRFALLIKLVALVGVGLIAGPIIALAIKGLIGLIVFGVIGVGTIALAPVIGDKAANWRLKLIKAEAARNPIETLEIEYGKRRGELIAKKEAIAVFVSRISKFHSKVNAFKKQHPEDQSVTAYEERLGQMTLLLESRKKKWREADVALDIFASEIDKARDVWGLSLAAIEADESAGSVEDEYVRRIRVNTSLDSVQDKMSLAFAQLDVELLEDKEPARLPHLPVQ